MELNEIETLKTKKAQPEAPSTSNEYGSLLNEGLNIIINDKQKNVNLSIKDLNEMLQKYIKE